MIIFWRKKKVVEPLTPFEEMWYREYIKEIFKPAPFADMMPKSKPIGKVRLFFRRLIRR